MTPNPPEERQPRVLRATPVLMCSDYGIARSDYVDKLCFTVVEGGGDPDGNVLCFGEPN